MALRADGLVAGGAPDGQPVAAVEEQDSSPNPVAAVGDRGSGKGQDRRDRWRGGKKRKADGNGRDCGGDNKPRAPYRELGLCYAHHTYGKAACSCSKPCSLSGN